MELTLRPLGVQPPLHRRRLDFFRKSFELSAAKAESVLGFAPAVDFEEGARRTAAWYQSRGLL
jgi:nucleoside-diphosphate-sugar epimerase